MAIRRDEEAYERCVLCNWPMEVRRDQPVEFRSYYVEGAGQLCKDCWQLLEPEFRASDDKILTNILNPLPEL